MKSKVLIAVVLVLVLLFAASPAFATGTKKPAMGKAKAKYVACDYYVSGSHVYYDYSSTDACRKQSNGMCNVRVTKIQKCACGKSQEVDYTLKNDHATTPACPR